MNQIHRPPRFVCLVFGLALLAGASSTRAMPVEHITSPRPAGWSVDYTGSISPETRQEIDRLGDQIHAASGAELVVVVIDSTGGEPSRDFAIRLFNHWGLDLSARGKGLLLFAALGDRSAEIVLGQELDTPANNQASEAIMQGEMVPRFRAGDPGSALLEGVRACAWRILHATPPQAETSIPMPPPAEVPVARTPAEEPAPARFGLSRSGGIFLISLLSLGLGGVGYLLMRALRCPRCQIVMTLLSEQEDDAHLTPAEKTEERVGAVNHEIWLCPQCGETKKRAWPKFFSGYSQCSSCGAKAVQSTSRILESATYSSTGTRRVDTSCAHCGEKRSYTMVIPRLERPRPTSSSTSSSSRSLSSRSSSSSSSSSSSRSSGSGGGRSSRGGASGKW
jgi:uncharacterized protein